VGHVPGVKMTPSMKQSAQYGGFLSPLPWNHIRGASEMRQHFCSLVAGAAGTGFVICDRNRTLPHPLFTGGYFNEELLLNPRLVGCKHLVSKVLQRPESCSLQLLTALLISWTRRIFKTKKNRSDKKHYGNVRNPFCQVFQAHRHGASSAE